MGNLEKVKDWLWKTGVGMSCFSFDRIAFPLPSSLPAQLAKGTEFRFRYQAHCRFSLRTASSWLQGLFTVTT